MSDPKSSDLLIKDSVIMGDVHHHVTVAPDSRAPDVDLGFSMRMDENQPDPVMPENLFTLRPDTKGPKSIAVILFMCAIILFLLAHGDISLHKAADLSTEEVETILATPNSQGDGSEEISVEQYQDFHDQARESGGYALRGYGLASSGLFIFFGSILLFRLNPLGAIISVCGALIGLASGIAGSLLVKGAADATLAGVLLLTYEITVYFCGVCMVMCLGITALPLINARARLALYPQEQIVFVPDSEE